MRKSRRRRPEVESLESMMLLSALVLSGSDHGTYSVKGTETATKGSGSVGPLGHVTTLGKSIGGGEGSVTLTSKTGKVSLIDNLKNFTIGSFAGTYTISGGTKAFAGATGSGKVEVTLVGSSTHGKYTITYD